MTKLRAFDAAEYLDTPEAQAEFITAALEGGDRAHITRAIGTVARARGMSSIAREAGINRESLYRSLSETGDPRLSTLLGVMQALGFSLNIAPVEADREQHHRVAVSRLTPEAATVAAGALASLEARMLAGMPERSGDIHRIAESVRSELISGARADTISPAKAKLRIRRSRQDKQSSGGRTSGITG
jgi:probable addiction module antidote protein